jgi:cytochrome c oxidase subunit 2
MKRLGVASKWLLAIALPVAGAAEASPALAATGLNPFPPLGESPNGQAIFWLYQFISPFALFIFFLVEVLLLIIILKYRRSAQPSGYKPPQWHGNTQLEIIWTVIPLVLMCLVGYFSFRTLQQYWVMPASAASDVNISITAHQYGWTYQYPTGVTVTSEGLAAADSPLVVPVGQLVRIKLDSIDVIHSWWVPELTGKTDAVPGYSNYTWIKVDRPGEWRGECAELCGTGHATMQIRVKAVSQDEFQLWLAQQKAKQSPPSPSPSPSISLSPSASPSPSR